jgi:AraC-like DNA-binding protein
MELITTGKRKFINKPFKIYFTENKEFIPVKEKINRFRIIFIEKGSLSFLLNGKEFFITSPALLLLDEIDRLDIIEENNLSYKTLVFHPNFINGKFDFSNIRNGDENFILTEKQDIYLFDIFTKGNKKVFTSIPFENKLKDYLSKMEKVLTLQEADCWPCHARCFLIELLFFFKNALNDKENIQPIFHAEKEDPFNTDKIISYLKQNYEKKISIDEICRQFYTNRTTLSARFKKETGISLFNYLAKIRIEIAVMLLNNSILNVYEVMLKTGFNDLSHFIKMFKKITGCTPTAFRKRHTWLTITKKDLDKIN